VHRAAHRIDASIGSGERSRWRSLLSMVPGDYPDRRARDARLLVWESAELARPVEVTGHAELVLHASFDRGPDGQVFAYLEDVAPDGSITYVTEGQLRARHRARSTSAAYLTPGVPRSYEARDARELEAHEIVELASLPAALLAPLPPRTPHPHRRGLRRRRPFRASAQQRDRAEHPHGPERLPRGSSCRASAPIRTRPSTVALSPRPRPNPERRDASCRSIRPSAGATKAELVLRIRVTLLLIVLGGVLAYAYVDRSQREARRSWERTLRVAVILVEQAPLEPSAVAALGLRVDPLEAQLEAEMRRYLPAGPKPFEIALLGPIVSNDAPPTPPDGGELIEIAKYQWALRRWVSGIDEAGKLPTRGFDSRVYLVARPPTDTQRKQVEGTSEAGGRVGVVSVELDATMADLALFVATHELFHTLGATERYAPDGSVLIPDGLGDPTPRASLPTAPSRGHGEAPRALTDAIQASHAPRRARCGRRDGARNRLVALERPPRRAAQPTQPRAFSKKRIHGLRAPMPAGR
jgi:hypothetical protein